MIRKAINFSTAAFLKVVSLIPWLGGKFSPRVFAGLYPPSKSVILDWASFLLIIGGTAFFVISHIWNANTSWPSFRYGAIPDGEIFKIIQRGIGLNSSSEFKGRLANIAKIKPHALPDGRLYAYEAMQALDHHIAFVNGSGADFRHSALANNIPTLFDVTRFASPGSVAAMNYFLTETMHYKQSQFLYPSKFNIRWMQFFGIRYVVHSELLSTSPYLLAAHQNFGKYDVYLYEIPDPNKGNYTPSHAVLSTSLPQTLSMMANPEFDFRKSVIVEAPITVPLVPATTAELFIINDALVFKGASRGWSLAVLPFEYSNCLVISEIENSSEFLPYLQRVNSHQIGLLFNKKTSAKIFFRFSPLANKSCRKKDVSDWKALDVRGAESFRGVSIFGGKIP